MESMEKYTLIGFALPKLDDKAIGVKVEVNFDQFALAFNVTLSLLSLILNYKERLLITSAC